MLYYNLLINLLQYINILIICIHCSALALTEPSREVYHEDDSKAGSMLSLVHSNSSTSVGPNSL